jgi:hypothetical protein
MQVTVGAKCWDGARSKSLMEKLRAEVLPRSNVREDLI